LGNHPPIGHKASHWLMLREIDFLQKLTGGFKLFACAETSHLNIDTYKFKSSQTDKSRSQSADSSKAYSNLGAFKWMTDIIFWNCVGSQHRLKACDRINVCHKMQNPLCQEPTFCNILITVSAQHCLQQLAALTRMHANSGRSDFPFQWVWKNTDGARWRLPDRERPVFSRRPWYTAACHASLVDFYAAQGGVEQVKVRLVELFSHALFGVSPLGNHPPIGHKASQWVTWNRFPTKTYWWIQTFRLCGDKLLEYRYVQVQIIAKW